MATPEVLNRRPNSLTGDPHTPHRALILITACCGVFVSFASVVVYTFSVFLKPLTETFGWSRGQVSLDAQTNGQMFNSGTLANVKSVSKQLAVSSSFIESQSAVQCHCDGKCERESGKASGYG
jgi:hypothetical protein